MAIFTLKTTPQNLWGGSYGNYFMEIQLDANKSVSNNSYIVKVKKAHIFAREYNFYSDCSINIGTGSSSFRINASGNNKYSGYTPNTTGDPNSSNNWYILSPEITLTIPAKSDGTCPNTNCQFIAQNSSVHWISGNKQVSAYTSFNRDISDLIQQYAGGPFDTKTPVVKAEVVSVYPDKVSIKITSDSIFDIAYYQTTGYSYVNVTTNNNSKTCNFDVYMTNDWTKLNVKVHKKGSGADNYGFSPEIVIDNKVPVETTLSLRRTGRNRIEITPGGVIKDNYNNIIGYPDEYQTFINGELNNVSNKPYTWTEAKNEVDTITVTSYRRYVNGIKVSGDLKGPSVSKEIDMLLPQISNIQTSELLDNNNNLVNVSFDCNKNVVIFDTIPKSTGTITVNNFEVRPNTIQNYSIEVKRINSYSGDTIEYNDEYGPLTYLTNSVDFEVNSYPYIFEQPQIITNGTKLIIKGRIKKYRTEERIEDVRGNKSSLKGELIKLTASYIGPSEEHEEWIGETDTFDEEGSYSFEHIIPLDTRITLGLENNRSSNNAYTSLICRDIESTSGPFIFINGEWKKVTPYVYSSGEWKKVIPHIYNSGWKNEESETI